jgi:hypothetical protein
MYPVLVATGTGGSTHKDKGRRKGHSFYGKLWDFKEASSFLGTWSRGHLMHRLHSLLTRQLQSQMADATQGSSEQCHPGGTRPQTSLPSSAENLPGVPRLLESSQQANYKAGSGFMKYEMAAVSFSIRSTYFAVNKRNR